MLITSIIATVEAGRLAKAAEALVNGAVTGEAGETTMDPTHPTFCPTCESSLLPGTRLSYFAQSPLCPKKNDLEFGAELECMLNDIGALFKAIGFAENIDSDTVQQLGALGYTVAVEATRRWELFTGAVRALEERANQGAALVAKLSGNH